VKESIVMNPVPAQSGVSLLELMIAVTILGILLALSGPGLADFVEESRLSGSSREFVVDFALARNEAAMRGQPVTVCTSADGAACANDSWGNGRLVFVDNNGTVGVVDAGDLILSTTPALNTAIETTPTGAAGAFFLSFAPNGQLAAPGRIQVCLPGHERRVVNIHRSGSATLDRETVTC
jgi:type IV fimbrial biogenesis protein FimT